MLLDKIGISKGAAIVSFSTGLTSILLAFTQNKYHFYILRFFIGVFQAGLFPFTLSYFGLIYPKRYSLYLYGLLASVPQFARPFGAVLGMIFLMIGDGWLFGLYAWQCLFLIEGIFCCLYFFVPYFLLPNNAFDFKQLTYEERNWLINELESQKDDNKEKAEFKSSFFRTIKNKRFWIASISDGLAVICYLGLLSFVTLVVSEMLVDDSSIASEKVYSDTCADSSDSALASILASVPYLFAGVMAVLLGYYGEYIKNIVLFKCFSQLLTSVFIILWIFMKEYIVIGMILLTIAAMFGNGTYGVIFKIIEIVTEKKDRLLGFSLFGTVSMCGAILGPILVGIAVDMYGFNGGMIVCVISLWIATFLISLINLL